MFDLAIGKLGRSLARYSAIALVLSGLLWGCGSNGEEATVPEAAPPPPPPVERIVEVAPPSTLPVLEGTLAAYQPQVRILSPQPDDVIEDNRVRVELEVRDYPIYKDAQWQLGPHVNVVLDDEPAQAVYDLDESIAFEDLAPGTHSLRVFAARPWEEGFKNEGAYAETTFHIYAKTGKYAIVPETPLITYNSPQGNYGAQPILLDYYLTNAPLRLFGESSSGNFDDWRVRITINGQSFLMDEWMPIYLQGFQPGTNWVQVEAIDGEGNAIANGVYNNTVHLVTYEPGGEDTLSKIARGELESDRLLGIVDPNSRIEPAIEAEEPAPTEPVEELQSEAPEAEIPSDRDSAPDAENSNDADAIPQSEPEAEDIAGDAQIAPESEGVSEAEQITGDRDSAPEDEFESQGAELNGDADSIPQSEPEAEDITGNAQIAPESEVISEAEEITGDRDSAPENEQAENSDD